MRSALTRARASPEVDVPELYALRRWCDLWQAESRVVAGLADGVGLSDVLRALCPGGSVTGAPKVSALAHIAALEPVGRGASMGALGRIHPSGDLELALTIRTFAVADGEIHLWAGGGIVWDSEPSAEIEESWLKARPLLAAVGSPVPEAVAT
jgi:para-aminobenzoate synthetase component 1